MLNQINPLTFRPLHDLVLVEIQGFEKTAGGIVIPDSVKTDDVGVVRALGPGRWTHEGRRAELLVKKDDRVLLGGTPRTAERFGDRKQFVIVGEDMILGIFGEREPNV